MSDSVVPVPGTRIAIDGHANKLANQALSRLLLHGKDGLGEQKWSEDVATVKRFCSDLRTAADRGEAILLKVKGEA